jgi:hypothetical protein
MTTSRNKLLLTPQAARRQGLEIPAPAKTAAPPLTFGGRMAPPPNPATGTFVSCDSQRVMLAGGDLFSLTLHPSVIPFEQLYRRLPEEGMFDPSVSPTNPFVFELGAYRVPERMTLGLYDLRPDIYRLSGVDPGDFVPVEARRFGSIMGFQLTVDQRQAGNTVFQLDPIAIQRTSQQAFQPPIGPDIQPVAAFNIAAANSFAGVAGAGTGLLPQRPTRYGALDLPFTLFARSGQTVQVRCVIFRPLPSPIAFIEYDIAGVLLPELWTDAMLRCVEPTRQGQR